MVRKDGKTKYHEFREKANVHVPLYEFSDYGRECLTRAVYCDPPFVHNSINRDKMIGVSGFWPCASE